MGDITARQEAGKSFWQSGTIENGRRVRFGHHLAIIRGNNIFICISETTAVVSEILFHGKGRDGKRHFYAFPGFGLLCENLFGAALRLRSNESRSGAFKQASGLH